MRWWLSTRLDPISLALIVFPTLAICVWAGDILPVPRIGFGDATYVLLFPAVIAAGIVAVTHRGLPEMEALGVPRVWWLSRATPLVVTGVVVLIWLVWGQASAQQSASAAAIRNLVGYLGLGLLTHRLLGGAIPYAVPIFYAVIVSVLGSDNGPVEYWPIVLPARVDTWLAAVSLFAAGCYLGTGRSALRRAALRCLAGTDTGHDQH